MNKQKIFKVIAIVSYLLIVLMGEMIGLPFFFWLVFTLFDFGNIDQLFAFLAVSGLTINCFLLNSKRTLKILLLEILCFMLLLSPLLARMAVVPIEKFNYLAFTIPLIIFCLLYLLSICFSVKEYRLSNAQQIIESTRVRRNDA